MDWLVMKKDTKTNEGELEMRVSKLRNAVTIAIMVPSIVFTGCGKSGGGVTLNSPSAIVRHNKDVWKIHRDIDKQEVTLVLNGKVEGTKSYDLEMVEYEPIMLPDTDELDAKDLTGNEEVSKLLWEATLTESAQQVKFYEVAGYKEVLRAETPKFIEIYMENGDELYKRIIVTNGLISIGDVETYNVDIEDYVY